MPGWPGQASGDTTATAAARPHAASPLDPSAHRTYAWPQIMNDKKIRTLIVDDHAVVRSGYRAYLQGEGFEVVAEAESADEAYLQYKAHRPDVVIMDIMLSGASGIEASRRIVSHHPGARILMFSMYSSPVLIQQALDVGALGVVGKESDPEVLVRAAATVARGQRYLDSNLAQALVFFRYDQRRTIFEALSSREFEILQMMVSGAKYETIGLTLKLSAKTVANRASMIRQKLGVSTDIQLVRLAAEAGVVSWAPAITASPAGAAPSRG